MNPSEKLRTHTLTCHKGNREAIERELVALLLKPGPTPQEDLRRLMNLLDRRDGKLILAYSKSR